jgi:hypothetical protein
MKPLEAMEELLGMFLLEDKKRMAESDKFLNHLLDDAEVELPPLVQSRFARRPELFLSLIEEHSPYKVKKILSQRNQYKAWQAVLVTVANEFDPVPQNQPYD